MKQFNLENMIKGWFVGDFNPVVWNSKDFEIAIKYYKSGDREAKHVHHLAKELTTVVTGKVKMNDQIFIKGDIITLEEGEPTDFEALEDTITVVVKTPSVKNDKHLI